MSEDQLYEIARKRIDRRNRRWLLLGVNFFFFLMYLGVFTAYSGIPRNVGAFFALAWMGVLVLHVFYLNITQNRDEAIDGEVAKLREAIYEKPKRLGLTDDGELTDIDSLDETPADSVDDDLKDNLDELPVKRRSNSL
ncbi:MAG: hypothetical protein GC204_02530 [Chloroflexi bacterium]|nr:hypothetical protein [Chloroflexota bacterium]